jgi:anti-sigma B factor antagonist
MTASLRTFPEVANAAAPEAFSCTWRSGYGAKWATLAGELDALTAPLLEAALRDAEADADLVVVDLRPLAFMDRSGVRVIFQSSERLRQSGRLMAVVRGSGPVARALTLVRAASAIQVFDLEPAEPAFQVLLQLAAIDDLLAQRTDLFGDLAEGGDPCSRSFSSSS